LYKMTTRVIGERKRMPPIRTAIVLAACAACAVSPETTTAPADQAVAFGVRDICIPSVEENRPVDEQIERVGLLFGWTRRVFRDREAGSAEWYTPYAGKTRIVAGDEGSCAVQSSEISDEMRTIVSQSLGGGDGSYRLIYEGPNSNGKATRRVYCSQSEQHSLVALLTIADGDAATPFQFSMLSLEGSCATFMSASTVAIPK
jgi:hypothetical protein